MDALAQAVVWLNAVANALGRPLLAPIGAVPGWLSATIIAGVSGVLLLFIFKHTSNQSAIKRVGDDRNAQLLALRLFKDSPSVALRTQGRLLVGGLRLFVLSLVPILVMAVPVSLLLGQLGLWYQYRALRPGEEALMTVKLKDDGGSRWPEVRLRPAGAIEVAVGPVRVRSKREICWIIRARERGAHRLEFQVDGQPREKQLAVGEGFMRVSARRPAWDWSESLLHPAEKPFPPDSAIQSIQIDYPQRASWTSGTDFWVIYWFAISMVAALCFRRALGVNL